MEKEEKLSKEFGKWRWEKEKNRSKTVEEGGRKKVKRKK